MSEILIAFKYFVDDNGSIHAFAADGSQDAYIGEHLKPADMDKIRDTLVPPFSLPVAQDKLFYEVNAIYTMLMQALNANYPALERETWSIQLAEAKDLITNGETAVTPFIDAMIDGRDITRIEMAQKIVEKDTEYRERAGKITGVKQDHVKAIESIALLPKKSGKAACEAYDYSVNWPDLEPQSE